MGGTAGLTNGQTRARAFRVYGLGFREGIGSRAALEATQGQIDGFFSQLPYKCHQNRVAHVGD